MKKKEQLKDKLFNCKSCIKRLIRMVEAVPHSLQNRINKIMDRLSDLANKSYTDIRSFQKDDLDLNLRMQMGRMS